MVYLPTKLGDFGQGQMRFEAWCWYIKTYKTDWVIFRTRAVFLVLIFQHHGSQMGYGFLGSDFLRLLSRAPHLMDSSMNQIGACFFTKFLLLKIFYCNFLEKSTANPSFISVFYSGNSNPSQTYGFRHRNRNQSSVMNVWFKNNYFEPPKGIESIVSRISGLFP